LPCALVWWQSPASPPLLHRTHGATQDAAGNRAASLDNPGAILEFTYSPAK